MKIRLALNSDCRHLPAIQDSAARLFAEADMLDVAGDPIPDATTWEPYCASETLWVAVDEADRPLGFLASGQTEDVLFIYELAVARDHQRQGTGRALLQAAEVKAEQLGVTAIYLTTFCDVAWNGLYYAQLGFTVVADKDLPPMLQQVMAAERVRWSGPNRARCAMRKYV